MTPAQLKTLFPQYSKMFDDSGIVAMDSSDHFYFHGVKGEADFMFQFGHLKWFRWVYSNGKKPFTLLTKKDRKKLSKVFKGLIADYGPFQVQTTFGDFYWRMPRANVACNYSARDFRFGVFDSAFVKMMFAPTPNQHDSIAVKR